MRRCNHHYLGVTSFTANRRLVLHGMNFGMANNLCVARTPSKQNADSVRAPSSNLRFKPSSMELQARCSPSAGALLDPNYNPEADAMKAWIRNRQDEAKTIYEGNSHQRNGSDAGSKRILLWEEEPEVGSPEYVRRAMMKTFLDAIPRRTSATGTTRGGNSLKR